MRSKSLREQVVEDDDNEDEAPKRSLSWEPSAADAELLAVLDGPRKEGEPRDEAFRRKEHELGAIFLTLTAKDSLELQRRVGLKLPGDVLADHFGRLTGERRARLMAFLVSLRRRFAIVPREGRHE